MLIIKSIILGFLIAAPVGPMCVLCINRTLNKGFLSGLLTGFGIASADAVYGCVVGFGLTAVSNYLIAHTKLIHMVGGLLLCYIGIKTLLSKITISAAKPKSSGDYISAFFLTLTNPMTIITFIAVFSGLGIGTTHPNIYHAIIIILGIFLGSLFWWLTVNTTVVIVRHKINLTVSKGINILSGLIILGFGVWIIISGMIS